jgi:hypothetical protein
MLGLSESQLGVSLQVEAFLASPKEQGLAGQGPYLIYIYIYIYINKYIVEACLASQFQSDLTFFPF